MHPLTENLDSLTADELEKKINDLSQKYFQTGNTGLKQQISMILDDYKSALQKKREEAFREMMESRNKDLDKLIKVD